MDPVTGAIIAAGIQGGSSLLGGMFGASGQAATNAQQLDMFNRSMQFNAQQADINRRFQYEFSGSQYQRAVGDMRAAGLNPILAIGSPATAPGGSGAIAPGQPSLGNPGASLGQGVASAGQAAGQAAQIKVALQQAEKDATQADLNKASEQLVNKQGTRTDQETATSKSAERLNEAATVNKVAENAMMLANANSANAVARVNQRIAEDTERYGDSPVSKAVGGIIRMLGTARSMVPNSAVNVQSNPPPKDMRPGVPGSPVFGPTTKWNTP